MNLELLKNSLVLSAGTTILAGFFGASAALWTSTLRGGARQLVIALAIASMARLAAVEHLLDGGSDLDNSAADLADFFRVCFERLDSNRGSADRERCSLARNFSRPIFTLADGQGVIAAGGVAGVRYCVEQFRGPGAVAGARFTGTGLDPV